VLGEGGMGLVVAARHRELGHRVAVKCLHASALGNEGAVVRFEREARAAAALTSEYVARVIDVERLEDGSPYMVMELLEGEDLHTMLRREGALSIVDTIRFASHAADGLAEAHAVGIVHRDVKPSNLFVTRRKKGGPVVKVLDFGIAKNVADSTDRGLTATQALLGSPQYMSPEQVRGGAIDGRTDVYTLGALAYELLAGVPPFEGATAISSARVTVPVPMTTTSAAPPSNCCCLLPIPARPQRW
jgi:serine/threonine-protein kinase